MVSSWISSIGSLILKIPMFSLVCYVLSVWRNLFGTLLLLTVMYSVSKNVYAVVNDQRKLPKVAFPFLMFFDFWYLLAKISQWTILELSTVRSILDRILMFGKYPCASTTIKIEKVSEECDVYVYTPDVITHEGCMVYVHGGGWIFLSAKSFNYSVSWLSYYLGMVVVSVEYRLAPEHPFPAALIDCYAALEWVFASVRELGVDPDKVFVGGDSAGGNLAATLCLLYKDRQLQTDKQNPKLAGQILIYPVLQSHNQVSGSMSYNKSYFPTPSQLANSISLYTTGTTRLVNEVGKPEKLAKTPKFWNIVTDNVSAPNPDSQLSEVRNLDEIPPGTSYSEITRNSYIFPLHAEDLSGLPPAYILVASADPLRDQGEWYAKYLQHFNVPTVITQAKHCHGFMSAYDKNIIARGELVKIKGFIHSI